MAGRFPGIEGRSWRLLAPWLGAMAMAIAAPCGAQDPGAAIPAQVALIDRAIEQGWIDYEIKPSKEADDAIWCRRVYLDVIGRIPTLEELEAFVRDRAPNKRAALVRRLLYDDRYTEEYARNWAAIWTNILIGRSGGTERNDLTNREGMMKYLRDSFAANKPYDAMVLELVTGTGSTKPGTDHFNGATNFLAGKVNEEDGVLATSATSRIFLGMQVQCTQCHNHPFNQWKQQKFWDFNAFFRQTRSLRRFVPGTRDIDHVELVDQDFPGEAGDPSDAIIFYELRNGLTRAAYPVFLDGTEIGVQGYVSEVNRRAELGRLMMGSEFLDRMIVNRTWAHFLGYGFTKPIDDLGPHNPASHPELLEELGEEFRKHSYDLKQLMQWIVLSKPYQLSYQTTPLNESDDPMLGELPKFSHFYLRQMRAEELYQSLIVASQVSAGGSYEQQENQRQQWLRQFTVAFGTDEGDEATTFNGSIPQALMMFNGDLVKQAIRTDSGTLLGGLIASDRRFPDKVNRLFLAGVARRATPQESQMALMLLRARGGDAASTLQDLWWAILNSNEFILQH